MSIKEKALPYGRHYIDEDDIAAVVDVLRNGWITQGPKVGEFEAEIAEYVGAKYAVAVSSATAALHIAYLATRLGKASKVVISPNTFVASANCILYGGGVPIFCDIDAHTLNMDNTQFANIVNTYPDIKAVIPVHFGGLACDMEAIHKTAIRTKIQIIEDASQAFGATYNDGSRVGNCKYSEMTVFSFHPVKGITSGEGGLITTNNEKLYVRLMSLRSHGITKDANEFINLEGAMQDGRPNPWYYEMQELGYNYRITDFQCALALSQFGKIEQFLQRRREITHLYDELLDGLDCLELTQTETRDRSANHLYVVRIDFEKINKSRGDVMRQLMEKGVGTQVHYIPVTMQPYYKDLGYQADDYKESSNYYQQTLTIPIFFGLSNGQVEFVVKQLQAILK